jgi:hypothetical protein
MIVGGAHGLGDTLGILDEIGCYFLFTLSIRMDLVDIRLEFAELPLTLASLLGDEGGQTPVLLLDALRELPVLRIEEAQKLFPLPRDISADVCPEACQLRIGAASRILEAALEILPLLLQTAVKRPFHIPYLRVQPLDLSSVFLRTPLHLREPALALGPNPGFYVAHDSGEIRIDLLELRGLFPEPPEFVGRNSFVADMLSGHG